VYEEKNDHGGHLASELGGFEGMAWGRAIVRHRAEKGIRGLSSMRWGKKKDGGGGNRTPERISGRFVVNSFGWVKRTGQYEWAGKQMGEGENTWLLNRKVRGRRLRGNDARYLWLQKISKNGGEIKDDFWGQKRQRVGQRP